MIWFLLAALTAVYFLTVAVYTGLESRFHLVWLGLALFLTITGVISCQCSKGMIHISAILLLLFRFCGLLVLGLLFLVILRIVRNGRAVPDKGAEYVIVLGAHVNGSTISKALQKRLDAAYDYYRENPDAILILSGAQGKGEDLSEAEAMRSYLDHRGIPANRLLKEEASYNTEENIRNCRDLADLEERKTVIITNRFHLFRSMAIARKQGLKKVQGLGAGEHPLMQPTYYLREAIAVIYYRYKRKI